MATKKNAGPEVSPEPVEPKVVSGPETEQEMITRIMKGNGSSDEYVDKYHKDFPVPWR